jgi:hypothetical protein
LFISYIISCAITTPHPPLRVDLSHKGRGEEQRKSSAIFGVEAQEREILFTSPLVGEVDAESAEVKNAKCSSPLP